MRSTCASQKGRSFARLHAPKRVGCRFRWRRQDIWQAHTYARHRNVRNTSGVTLSDATMRAIIGAADRRRTLPSTRLSLNLRALDRCDASYIDANRRAFAGRKQTEQPTHAGRRRLARRALEGPHCFFLDPRLTAPPKMKSVCSRAIRPMRVIWPSASPSPSPPSRAPGSQSWPGYR